MNDVELLEASDDKREENLHARGVEEACDTRQDLLALDWSDERHEGMEDATIKTLGKGLDYRKTGIVLRLEGIRDHELVKQFVDECFTLDGPVLSRSALAMVTEQAKRHTTPRMPPLPRALVDHDGAARPRVPNHTAARE